jgi:general secretion pathway protein A
MYSSFYGFFEKPFEVTPDPKYLYSSPSHQETLASLVYGIKERRGFICLTGEVGTGKTMLIHAALDRLDENTKVAYITNTALTFEQLLVVTLEELGIIEPGSAVSKMEGIRLLNEFTVSQLSKGGNVVLIIDEAHNLDADSMENLRLLSNLETRKHKLIQIVLSGQPELDAKLDRPELRQLAQRISVRRFINSLTEEETYAYTKHRLDVAGYRGSDLFKNEARKMVHEYSCGIPRKINILCDNALLIGFALEKKEIDGDCVKEAARDLKWEPPPGAAEPARQAAEPALEAAEPALRAADPAPSSVSAQTAPLTQKRVNSRIALGGSMGLAAGILIGAWIAFGRSGPGLSEAPPSLSGPNVQVGLNTGRQNGGQPAPDPTSFHSDKADWPQQLSKENVEHPKRLASSSSDAKNRSKQPEAPISKLGAEKQNVPKPTGTTSEKQVASPIETTAKQKEESAFETTVIVERNDTLSSIIQRAYGRYKPSLLAKVLKENPEIQRPDFISIGQKVTLPDLGEKDINN